MASLLSDPPTTASASGPAGRRRPDPGQAFRRAVVLLLMTLVLPGSAQLAAGNKRVGRIALRTWLGLLAVVAVLALLGLAFDSFVFWLLASGPVLSCVRVVLMVLAVAWVALFLDAWRLGDPLALRRKQRLVMLGLNGVLCLSLAGTLLFTAHLVGVQRTFLASTFGDGATVGAHDGRFNVLLLGGDSGDDRWGLRPDSIQVASIDAETGRTVLFGLPRNMLNFDFPDGSVMAEQFPEGYDCGSECELNSLATYAADNPELFEKFDNPAIEATKEGVEGITGLEINYTVMVNMQGFEKLVDAVGGLELNVREDIPIGGGAAGQTGTVRAGHRTLDGNEALWFARSRMSSDDYSRMARQKCVISAMVSQLSPQKVLLNFSALADAGSALVTTDLPRSEVDRFTALALKARSQPIRTVSFVPPMINTSDPDLDLIHDKVEQAVGSADADAPPAERAAAPKQAETTGGSIGNLRDGYGANQADDLAASC